MAVQSGDLEMIKMCLDSGAELDLMEVVVQIPPDTFIVELSWIICQSALQLFYD